MSIAGTLAVPAFILVTTINNIDLKIEFRLEKLGRFCPFLPDK